MIKKLFAVFLFVSILTQNYCKAQNMQGSTIATKWDDYLQNNFQEKLYIHTDKSTYLCGETIWFKIYNVEAFTNRPVDISKVAYIEILDANNKPVLQAKVALNKGKADGSLYIPIALQSGAYSIRGYTNWMKNFDVSSYFSKDIFLYNTLTEEQITEKKSQDKSFAIQFFPEGGNLVAGLSNKVAFKGVDNASRSFDFTAVILSGKNDTVAKFSPRKYGLGSFNFTPKTGEAYKVLISPKDGKPFIANLPQVFEEGVVMAVSQADGMNINVSLKGTTNQNQKFTLFVHSGKRVVFAKPLDKDDSVDIPLKQLGDGVSHFTLFDQVGHPICERSYFKKPEKVLEIDLLADKKIYGPREKVQLTVNSNSKDLGLEFSVAVYLADSLAKSNDIATSLLLTSELKGKVENAKWYLSDASAEEIDNLMLTHGWTRFRWEDILNRKNQEFKYLPEVDGHIISGKILNPKNGTANRNRIAFLSVPGKSIKFYTSSSNGNGDVNFFTKNLYGNSEIIAQTDFSNDEQLPIEINSPYSDKFQSYRQTEFSYASASKDLLKRSMAMQVNNAYSAKYFSKEIIPTLDSSAFYNIPQKVYKLDDYVRFSTMEEVLREYVPEIMISTNKKNYTLNMFDPGIKQYHIKAPLSLLDGVPLFDEDNPVIKIDPRKIKTLELVADTYFYGRNAFAGIASFKSYKGDLIDYQLPKNALLMDYDGLQNKREFYSPMYDGDKPELARIPDYRTTLFWSGDNQTDKEGKATLDFFTSDLDGKYEVVVQALSENGDAGSQLSTFEVIKK